jgi:hypothetical protein
MPEEKTTADRLTAYTVFESEILSNATQVTDAARRIARRRSIGVLASFTAAMLLALVAPRFGFGLICFALILHLQPEAAPGSGLMRSFIASSRAKMTDRFRRLKNRFLPSPADRG